MSVNNFNRKASGVYVVIVSVLLLELISAVQFYYTRSLLEDELEKRVETELTMKAIVVNSMLRNAQGILNDHLNDIKRNIAEPDSMFRVVRSIVEANRNLNGGWVAFAPDFYPQKGRLFEPYAMRKGDNITVVQIASDNHDYSTNPIFHETAAAHKFVWSKPYLDKDGTHNMITTCNLPFYDSRDSLQGITGVDFSLSWLGDTLNSRHIYPSSFMMLLTEDGEVISSPSDTIRKYKDTKIVADLINDSTQLRTLSRSGRSEIIEFNSAVNGDNAYIFFANIRSDPHWIIAVVCYDNEVYSKLYYMGLNIAVLNLLALAVMIFLILRFVRNARRLSEARLAQEHVRSELSVAHNIQSAMIPQALPSMDSAEVAGLITPAKQVGGDLYDFFVRNEKLFFCIGDVSGKGIPSALIMAVTKSLFRLAAERENNAAHIMTDLNKMACSNNATNMFVTLFIGVLDLPTGHLRYCNAGHDLPLLCRPDGTVTPLNADANLPIGVFENTEYSLQKQLVDPGTLIFLYTDGLTEAMNEQHAQFGLHRVERILADSASLAVQELPGRMSNAVHNFVGEAEQSDDLTMLAIRYRGNGSESALFTDSITLANDVAQVPQLSQFVARVSERVGCDKATSMQVKLAVEEAVVNCMNYAYPAGQTGTIGINARFDSKNLLFIITDNGVAFDPTEKSPADTSLSATDRPIGGLGILLVSQLMDSVNYERIQGKNVLTLKKIITKPTSE